MTSASAGKQCVTTKGLKMNNKPNQESRWLFCASNQSERTASRWSRLNLEHSGLVYDLVLNHKPVGSRVLPFLGAVYLQRDVPVWSHTDKQARTSESDALGERGVVWEP